MTYVEGQPSTFFDAILAEDKRDHLAGIDYSVTTLLRPPREVQLCKRHKDELPPRAPENILATFIGTAVHSAVEASLKNHPDYLIEYRFEFDEEVDGEKVKIAGTCDMYSEKHKRLVDHKTTTTFIYGGELKKEWVEQLNIYAYFLRRTGHEVETLTINCIYKDWRPNAGRYKTTDYPPLPVMEFNFKPWSYEDQEAFYKRKLKEHLDAVKKADDDLPRCTSDDMWVKPESYAVYRPGASKAIRLLPTAKEAERYIRDKRLNGCMIEHRPGERTKCEKYCSAAPFCNQFQEWKKKQESDMAEDILSGRTVGTEAEPF